MAALSDTFPLASEDSALFKAGADSAKLEEGLKTAIGVLAERKSEFPAEVNKALGILAASFKAGIEEDEANADPNKPPEDAEKARCPKCGAEIEDGMDVCPKCGEKLAVEEEQEDEGEKDKTTEDGKAVGGLVKGIKAVRTYLASVGAALEALETEAAGQSTDKTELADVLVEIEEPASKGAKTRTVSLADVLDMLEPTINEVIKEGVQ